MSKMEELKRIKEQKRQLAEQEKELKEALNQSKDQRKQAALIKTESRKLSKNLCATLRDKVKNVKVHFKDAKAVELSQLADEIMESASELSGLVRKFAEAQSILEKV